MNVQSDVLAPHMLVAELSSRQTLTKRILRCTAKAVALRLGARQRGACFKASYQRYNKLTKQHTKQTAAVDLQAKKKPRVFSSLHSHQTFCELGMFENGARIERIRCFVPLA
eukprot:6189589-Pleurochrysis_carterae.AAC.1